MEYIMMSLVFKMKAFASTFNPNCCAVTPSTVEMSVPVAQYTTARDSHLYTA